MADNTEYLPQIGVIDDSRTERNYKLIGDGNVVSISAKDIVVNGQNNFVGEECQRINILASSGCTVTSGVTDISITGSSGLTINESSLTYIKNVLITDSSFSGGAVNTTYRVETLDAQSITATDATVELIGESVTVILLPPASGHNRIYNIKNLQVIDSDVEVYGGSDQIDSINDRVTLSQYDSVTVQSDGGINYIIL